MFCKDHFPIFFHVNVFPLNSYVNADSLTSYSVPSPEKFKVYPVVTPKGLRIGFALMLVGEETS